jgi:hypothetical protein
MLGSLGRALILCRNVGQLGCPVTVQHCGRVSTLCFVVETTFFLVTRKAQAMNSTILGNVLRSNYGVEKHEVRP